MTIRTGNARFPKTNYKTSRHCVAYLDMLGGKNVICNDTQSEHLNKINMIFYDALEESKMFAADIFVKIFSDNILLAIPTDNDSRGKNIEKIVGLVNNIISEMADYGYLMRGAITEGDFFGNNIIAYGKALVEVVKLEEECSIYPRVIAKKEIVELLSQYFYRCEDGWDMLNPYIWGIGSGDFPNFRCTFLNQLKSNKNNEKIWQKIMWAINNFNAINNTMRRTGLLRSLITRSDVEKAME